MFMCEDYIASKQNLDLTIFRRQITPRQKLKGKLLLSDQKTYRLFEIKLKAHWIYLWSVNNWFMDKCIVTTAVVT